MTQNNTHGNLSLPCLRGSIGDWNYYNVVMPFKELKRIDNHHIIKESKELDKWLQRNLSDRKFSIKDYLLEENQRFFNSIIVGVYGDVPDWYSLDLSVIENKFKIQIGEQVSESLGVLALSGEEILFTIDGQHRIEGIKLALENNPERFDNDELSIIFVAHAETELGRIRTRKLFATINREAKAPSPNDLAIIDEIYAYNILARDLYSKFKDFKSKIGLTDNRNIDRKDHTNFTNLLSLVEINKKFLKLSKGYRQSKYYGPDVDARKELYQSFAGYWSELISNIDEYKNYFSGKTSLSDYRNSERNKPLNFLFMPIGMKLIAEMFVYFKKANKSDTFFKKINKLNFDLHEGTFAKLYFDPAKNTMKLRNETVAKKLFLYLLGENVDENDLRNDLAKAYGYNELSPEYKSVKLPVKLK